MAQIYVDSILGLDTNSGTIGAPLKSIRAAKFALSLTNDTIFVKAGQYYDPVNASFLSLLSGNYSSGILKVDRYGDGDDPIWDASVYSNPGDTGWTHVSSGIWKKVIVPFYCRRVFAASANLGQLLSQRAIGQALYRAPISGVTNMVQNPTEAEILAALSATNIWAPGGSALGYAVYMYTGSTVTSPPDYYQGLSFVAADGSTAGVANIVELQNVQNVWIRHQGFSGMTNTAVRILAANADTKDTKDILIEDCQAYKVYQSAVKAMRIAQLSPTWMVRNVTVRRFTGDTNTNSAEQEKLATETSLSGAADMFSAESGSYNVTYDRCLARNSGHVGFAIGSASNGSLPAYNCSVINSEVYFASWTTYSRAIASYNGTGHKVNRLKVTGQNTRSQLGGGIEITNGIWLLARQSLRKPGTDQWVAGESYYYNNGSGLGDTVTYCPVWPTAVVFKNNTYIGECSTSAVTLASYTNAYPVGGSQYPAGAFVFADNIFYSTIAGNGKAVVSTNGGGNAPVIPTQVFTNNSIYTGATLTVSWAGVSYALNAAAGFASNDNLDPLINIATGRPMNGSTAIGAGAYGRPKTDYYGNPRPKTWSRGAIDLSNMKSYVR